MNCQDAREHFEALIRGQIETAPAEALQAHLAACASCRDALQVQREVRALIRAEAPRYAAPPQLRARIRARVLGPAARPGPAWPAWRAWVLRPRWAVVALAGVLAVLAGVWGLSLWTARDPVTRLMAQALAGHEEYARAAAQHSAADPAALLEPVRSRAGFAFEPVFQGDAQVHLVNAMVSELPGTRTAAFVYRDAAGRYSTLFLMPEAGISVPEQGRMPIETYRPYHRVTGGKQLFLWKQRQLACLLVVDGSPADGAALFLKVRKAA
jgi:mycothiol system anti-sigma-R factor